MTKNKNKNSDFLVGLTYQPTLNNIEKVVWIDKLDNILCKILPSWYGPMFLSGDTNIDILKEISISKSYITILENHDLHQVVTKSTWNGLKSIDHIITNHDNVTAEDIAMW